MHDYESLKKVLDYDPETGNFIWLKSFRGIRKGSVAGSLYSIGYIYLCFETQRYTAHRVAFYFTHGFLPENIDHINGDKADNRACNLRKADVLENAWNAKISKSNTSGIKGVCWDKQRQKWRAHVCSGGNSRYLGVFGDKDEAERTVRAERERLHGTFANHG